uniref:Non-ribosomal peptide synthetase n=1 Tax=uncultured bacterium AB_9 TaxID=1630012 RepID=A0A0E3GLU9_9BACT|nr:non-ribosomal peptide synthetase [uncultured bacterium AB_9]
MSGTTAQEAVSESWNELLGVAPADPGDDFFSAGGDSLKAVLLVAAIRDRVGIVLPFRIVFDNSRFGELSERVALAMRESARGTEEKQH